MRITMLGVSGSGKTSFMSGLYQAFVASQKEGFHLLARRAGSPTAGGLVATNVALAELSFGRNADFPPPTARTTQWSFSLHRPNEICEIDWLDFRGGALTPVSAEASAAPDVTRELNVINGHLISSNALLLFVSSLHLAHLTPNRARHEAGVDALMQILVNYSREFPGRRLTILLCPTKVDALPAEYKEGNFSRLRSRVSEAFSGLSGLCERESGWDAGILPLTVVGDGGAITTVAPPKNIREPLRTSVDLNDLPDAQECVSAALFHCVGQTLDRIAHRKDVEIQADAAEIEAILSSRSIFSDALAMITRQKTSHERVDEIQRKLRRERDSLNRYRSHIAPMLVVSRRHVTPFLR